LTQNLAPLPVESWNPEKIFQSSAYNRVAGTASWLARLVAHRLLCLLVAAFVREGPPVTDLDDTVKRRWGTRIKARGIYRESGSMN
jgi:hypothetical protein